MRVLFAGTPDFAARALDAIIAAGHAIPLVLTQPDRPAGRGQQLAASPVKKLALAHDIPVYQPERLKTDEQRAPLLAVPAEVMVVAAYGLILPVPVLVHPRHGCLNIHASLLPRWRGAAPIQRALLAGDAETGVCVMQMEAGLDTGPVISRTVVPIRAEETAGSLHDRLAEAGAAAIIDALAELARVGRLEAAPQPDAGVTYADKITKEEARIDWTREALALDRQIRAFNPVPGAATTAGGAMLKVWRASRVDAPGQPLAPGAVALREGRMLVGCGAGGALALDEVQPAGGRRMPGLVFLNGHPEVANGLLGT